MPRKLKTYIAGNIDGCTAGFVSATSLTAAAQALGVSVSAFRFSGGETKDEEIVRIAATKPGQPFYYLLSEFSRISERTLYESYADVRKALGEKKQADREAYEKRFPPKT